MSTELADPTSAPPAAPESSDAEAPPRTSRRQLFRLGAALAAATFAPATAAEAQRITRPRGTGGKPSDPPAPVVDASTLLKLVNRVTMGATDEEVKRAKALGFTKYLDYHLNYKAIDDSAVDTFVKTNYPSLLQSVLELYTQDTNLLLRQLSESTVYRAAFSKRQLYERMVEFWSDHFTLYYRKVGFLQLIDNREVIRTHAFGKFPDMVWASAHSPAMLEYLDNTRSRGANPNQNYARELMELHTLGVDGGYTQDDVANLARILTGWTLRNRGDFYFDPSGHDFGAKVLLGQTFPAQSSSVGAAGLMEGENAVKMLALHPSTAKFIARKMTRYLLQYDPPQSLLDAVVATYTKTGGDIPSMIRTIFTSTNVQKGTAKYKRPFEFVISTIRATNPAVRNVTYPAGRGLTLVGQPLFLWEPPDGYPDTVDYWAGNVLQRWNFGVYMSTAAGDIAVDVAPLMKVATAAGVCDSINVAMFGGEMSAGLRQTMTTYLSAQTLSTARVREAVSLALSATEFMWY